MALEYCNCEQVQMLREALYTSEALYNRKMAEEDVGWNMLQVIQKALLEDHQAKRAYREREAHHG
jgi:hypothetical protein